MKLRILHLSQRRSYSTTPKKRLNFHLFLANQFVKEGNECIFTNQVALEAIACESIWFLRFLFFRCNASQENRMMVAFEDTFEGKLTRVHLFPASTEASLIVGGRWEERRKEANPAFPLPVVHRAPPIFFNFPVFSLFPFFSPFLHRRSLCGGESVYTYKAMLLLVREAYYYP